MNVRAAIRWQGKTTQRQGTVPVKEQEEREEEEFGYRGK